jgi:hypothetical protein
MIKLTIWRLDLFEMELFGDAGRSLLNSTEVLSAEAVRDVTEGMVVSRVTIEQRDGRHLRKKPIY